MFTPIEPEACEHDDACFAYQLEGGILHVALDHNYMDPGDEDFRCWTDVWIEPAVEGDTLGYADVRWGGSEGHSTTYFRLPFMDEINDDTDNIGKENFDFCIERTREINARIGELMTQAVL